VRRKLKKGLELETTPNKIKTTVRHKLPQHFLAITMAAFIHKSPHYDQKLRRSSHDAKYNNPNNNEFPYYEVWDLCINDMLLDAKDYSCRPQGVLSAVVDPKSGSMTQKPAKKAIAKRSPDFVTYYNQDSEGEGTDSTYSLKREVAFIAEVKPWQPGLGEDVDQLVKAFDEREFLEQVRDHAKIIMMEQGKARVWLLQCVGIFWRAGTLRNEKLSPFSKRRPTGKNKPRVHGTEIEWGPIQKLGHVDSDVQQLDFWLRMSEDVEID
jgi:hypothetical protein